MQLVKQLLTYVGAYTPKPVLSYLETGRWMRDRGFNSAHRYKNREQIFDLIASEVGQRNVLYLEFGVFQGESMRYWSQLLHNPESHLHGFDSFEGLPEDYVPAQGEGFFCTNGNMPVTNDPRVKFFKGWFSDTLPVYKVPAHDVAVINFDADLYSSTMCVFRHLRSVILPGTYLYFDEFANRDHEMKAFDEFLSCTGLNIELVGATRTLARVAFKVSSAPPR